jgi:hypothetical protein
MKLSQTRLNRRPPRPVPIKTLYEVSGYLSDRLVLRLYLERPPRLGAHLSIGTKKLARIVGIESFPLEPYCVHLKLRLHTVENGGLNVLEHGSIEIDELVELGP